MAYSLAVSYAGQALIDGFNFVSIPDPTDGFVAYQNLASSLAYGYATVNTTTNRVRLSVDSTNTYDPDGSLGGRPSVRIESKQPVNQGLVIGDFAHMPGSVCGTWPAFWLYGPDWPSGGEIDILEGANMAYRNIISAHTGEACTLPSTGLYTGTPQYTNCTYDEDIGLVEGCNYLPPASDTSSYGDDFNAVGGGVYAMDWTSESIRIWHFPRNKIPQNIVDKKPDPSTWGSPQALFGDSGDPDSCDVGISFYNMSIVLDIDFCGDYAGGTQWGSSSCYAYASSCEIWVGGSPSQFANSFWDVNYIDVYSRGLVSPTNPSSSASGLPASEPVAPSSAIVVAPSSTGVVDGGGGSLPTSEGSGVAPSTQGDGSLPTPIATPPGSAGGSDGVPGPTSANGPLPSGPFSGNTPIQSLPSVAAASSGPPGGVSRTTPSSSSPSPVDSLVPGRNPATIGNFALLGCFGSTTSFSTFTLSGDNGLMTNEVCVGLCSGRVFSGVHERTCYCADALDAGTSALPDRSRCNIPCPGNQGEFCGGNNLLAKRDAPNSFLLTVYINLVGSPAANPPPAPGMGGTAVATVTQTITSTVTYTTVCSTNPALLVTQEYCTTLKVPDCARCPAGKVTKPIIPMTAITQTCNKCGAYGESTVTLTIPVGVASGWANGGNIGWQQPGSKPADVGAPAPGGGIGQQPGPKPPTPGAPPAAPGAPGAPVAPAAPAAPAAPVAPGAPGGGPVPGSNGYSNPAPQPGGKVGNATVPAPTQQAGSTATAGLKPVQAGAERNVRMSAGAVFGVLLVGLLF